MTTTFLLPPEPVTSLDAMFDTGVRRSHGPNRTTSSSVVTTTFVVCAVTPNSSPGSR